MLYETDIPASGDDEFKHLILNLDESNSKDVGMVEATTANQAGLEFAVQGQDYLNIRPRYILIQGVTTDGKTVRRRITAGDPSNPLVVNGGTLTQAVFTGPQTVESVVFSVTGVVGEKRTLVPADDTGLDDGTAT
jgi:hypothetical protein